MPHRISIIIWLLLFTSLSMAQKFFVTVFDQSNGLPSNAVQEVVQDESGFIWVATDAGLARFDGRQFTTLQGQLKSQHIKSFSHNDEGELFFCNDRGMFALKSGIGQTELLPVMAAQFPNHLFHDSQGRCWISQPDGQAGLLRAGQLQLLEVGRAEMTGRSDSEFSFAEDRSGRIWLASEQGGLFLFDEKKQIFSRQKKGVPVFDLQIAGDTLLAAGEGLRLYRITEQGQLILLKTIPGDGFQINCLRQTSDNNWYVGTNGQGIFQINLKEYRPAWQKVFGSNDPHRVEELPFKTIHHLYLPVTEDEETTTVWVSSEEGLGLMQSRFFDRLNRLSNDHIFVVSPNKNGVLVSLGNVTEISFDKSGFSWHPMPALGRVTSLAATGRGFWAGRPDGNIFRVMDGQVQTRYSFTDRGGGIFYISADSRGSLWFCQAPSDLPIVGVGEITPSGAVKFHGAEAGLGNRILVVKESPRGEIYLAGIGTKTYLYRQNPTSGQFENLSLPMPFRVSQNFEVHDLAVDHRGMVWLATTDGLLRHDSEHIQRIDSGLLGKAEVRAVTALPGGSIWAASSIYGLIHYDGHSAVLFDEASGLPSTISSYRCLTTDQQGRLWAGTAEGLVHSISRNPQPTTSVQPVFTQLKLKRGTISLADYQDAELLGNNQITVHFISLAFPGEDIHYQYLVQKQTADLLDEPSWSAPSIKTSLTLDKLSPGKYELHVRAQQPGGYAWSEPLVWRFQVHQVWYKTWWAITAFAALAIFLFWTYARIHILRLLDRIRLLESSLAAQTKAIEEKDALLEEQSKEIIEQQLEIMDTSSNLKILHILTQQITKGTSWKEALKIMAKAIADFSDIDAFEFAFLSGHVLHYSGYSKKEEIFTAREKEFDEKTSLTAWALSHNQSILIQDFEKEHMAYVAQKESYHYQSMILFPFILKNGKRAILNIYSLEKNTFQKRELMMVEILTDYLVLAAKGELKEI